MLKKKEHTSKRFTGLTDKNKKNIYEGDRIRIWYKFEGPKITASYNYTIIWDQHHLTWAVYPDSGIEDSLLWHFAKETLYELTLI